MSITQNFDVAMERAEHLLRLHDLLYDSRSRRVRDSWRNRFRQLVNWRQTEAIVRVDGAAGDCILVMKASLGLTRKHFKEEYLSELLRAALVASVSAMDRLIHDVITERCWTVLSNPDAPRQLQCLPIPAGEVARALENLRKDQKKRPGVRMKQLIQKHIHTKTFQSTNAICEALKMVGVRDLWRRAANIIQEVPEHKDLNSEQLKDQINKIVERRNAIVHEGDLAKKSRSKGGPKVAKITPQTTAYQVSLIGALGGAIKNLAT